MDGNDSAFAPHIEPLAQAGAAPAEVVVAQTAQGTVIALDAASGGPLWRWVTHDPRASIARAGERIFVISALSDRPIWVELDPPPRLPEGIMGRHANAVSLTHTRTRPAAVTALRASDGAVLWRVPFYCSAISPSASAGISVADDTLLTTALSFERGVSELLALDCATGAPRWSYSIGPLPLATTSVQPMVIWAEMGKVAVLTLVGPHEETRFVTLDAMTGAVLWQGEQAPQHDEAVQENETSRIRFTTDYALKWPHHILRATRIDSGADVWQMALDDLSGARSVETSVLAADGRLHLFWRAEGRIRLRTVRATMGQDLWRWRSPTWLYALFLARQAIWRGQQAAQTRRWRPLVGDALHFRWLHPIRLAGVSSVMAANGRLYLATPLGVFAINARNGRSLWHALSFIAVKWLHAAVQ